MEKFIKFGNLEVEIKSDLDSSENKKSWGDSKEYLEVIGLRLPTLKELKYIHNLLYLNYGGGFEEGSEYWTSDTSRPWEIGSRLESHQTLTMNFRGTSSSKYNYNRMRFRGVRDI